MCEEKTCSFRVVLIIRDVQDQTVEDMQLNAESYIKDDIECNGLYIEEIELIKES